MITSSTSAAAALTSLGASTPRATAKTTSASFDQQLSQALSESLEKLGVTPGEINITIKNPAGTLASRQIVITYSDATAAGSPTTGTDSEAPATTGNAPATGSTSSSGSTGPSTSTGFVPNPFTGLTPGLRNAAADVAPVTTDWAPWDGPMDPHDQIPTGGGQVTSSGAPLIAANETPAANQYKYTGPAATNPYFTTPSNPLREGYVLGFANWFDEAMVVGSSNGPQPMNKILYSTEEGAQEALRLAQHYAPNATVTQRTFGGGVFSANKPMYMIDIGGGRLLNAGGLLTSYYTGGRGVSVMSDGDLERAIQMA